MITRAFVDYWLLSPLPLPRRDALVKGNVVSAESNTLLNWLWNFLPSMANSVNTLNLSSLTRDGRQRNEAKGAYPNLAVAKPQTAYISETGMLLPRSKRQEDSQQWSGMVAKQCKFFAHIMPFSGRLANTQIVSRRLTHKSPKHLEWNLA